MELQSANNVLKEYEDLEEKSPTYTPIKGDRMRMIQEFRRNETKSAADPNTSYLELAPNCIEDIQDEVSEFKEPTTAFKGLEPDEDNMNQVQQDLIEVELNEETLKSWCTKCDIEVPKANNEQVVTYKFNEKYNGSVEDGMRHGFGVYHYNKGISKSVISNII